MNHLDHMYGELLRLGLQHSVKAETTARTIERV